MRMKMKTGLSLIISIIAMIVVGIFMYRVSGEDVTYTAIELSQAAYNNSSLFWNLNKVGDYVDETSIEKSSYSTNWICFSHHDITDGTQISKAIRVRTFLNINMNQVGKYSYNYQADGVVKKGNNVDNDTTIKKIAYLIYAATVDSSSRYVGDGWSTPSKNALYYYFNTTNLENYVGEYSLKRLGSSGDYVAESKQKADSGNIFTYANTYASTEKASTTSSAEITSSSDSGAKVSTAQSTNDGVTYNYIGGFKIDSDGKVNSVTIKDGNNTRTVVGYAVGVGGYVSPNIDAIPLDNTTFYIVTRDNLTSSDISVTIETKGSVGGGTVINPKTGAKQTGYIKAKILFIGGSEGQATAIFRGDYVPLEEDYDDVTFTAKNNLGKLVVQKVGAYSGNTNYENVKSFGFKLYYLDGSTKRFVRINDSDTISGQTTVTVGSNTSYTAGESEATTIYTSSNGTITLNNISTEYEYYIQETDTSQTNYKAELIQATRKYGSGSQSSVTVDGNTAGPIRVELAGTNNTATTVTLLDYRKTGNLTIEKVDADNHNTKLESVEFKLKNKDTGYYVVAESTGDGEYNISDQLKGYTQNEADGTTFVTNASGKITINGLDVGNYEIIELNNPNYGYTVLLDNVTVTITDSETITETLENEKQTGNLKIDKQDADDANTKMDNVSFRIRRTTSDEALGSGYVIGIGSDGSQISTAVGTVYFANMEVTDNAEEATTFVTDEQGLILIKNILLGSYEVEEISVGDRYGYYLEEDNVSWEITASGGSTSTVNSSTTAVVEITRQPSTETTEGESGSSDTMTVKNEKQTGNIKIEKQDADDASTKMKEISFRLKRETSDNRLGSGYVVAMQGDSPSSATPIETVTGTVYFDNMTVTDNPEEATTFVTDEQGLVQIYNILVGTYAVEEISVGDKYGYYVNPDFITWEITASGGSTSTVNGSTTATIEVTRQPSTETSEDAVGTGTSDTIIVKNEKQTGNLRIEKQDADDSETKMEEISFRLRRETSDECLGSGYVVAMQGDSPSSATPLKTATGTVYFDNMTVTDNPEGATTFVTDERGLVEIYNILIGTYTVEEISVGDKYGYYVNPDYITWEITASGGATNTVDGSTSAKIEITRQPSPETSKDAVGSGTSDGMTVKNEKQTGNLKIQKKDADNDDMKLQGVSFRIRRVTSNECLGSGYVIGMQGDAPSNATPIETATGTVYFADMEVTNNASQATTFVTDEKGLIEIYNILIGEYVVEEISVGDHFGYDVDGNYISWEISNSNGQTSTVNQSTSATVQVVRQKSPDTRPEVADQGTDNADQIVTKNTRKYIKIRGFAWEERTDGKNSTKDYVWNDNTEDKRLANISVKLKTASGRVLDEAITDENGEYVFGNYDEDPSAIKIEIDDLVGAYIEFEYNGMSYQSIQVNPNFDTSEETDANGNTLVKYSGNTNKSSDEGLRTTFNNNYATISQGIASNTSGNKTYDIRYNYDAENHESKVIYGDSLKYGYDGQTYPISGVYAQYAIQAVTEQSSTNALCTGLTPEAIRQNAVVEIGGLNLGVEERQMPDLFVLEDMEKVEISLNDYTHTYQYAQRFEDPTNYAGGDVVNADNTLNVAVRFANKYIENSYSRAVYASDIVYNKQAGNEGKLKIFVTYRIKITNESSSIYTTLKTLSNYYDARYENVVVRDENGNIIESQVDNSYNQNGFKKVNIQANYQIPDGQTREMTITYQLSNAAINSILNEQLTLDSISEVSAYSSYSDSNYSVPYAGIDIDSAPGTVDTGNYVGTLEDDTDKAPSLILNVKEGRVVEGTVWEDSAIQDLLEETGYNKERKGDGIYAEGSENVVRKVKVELLTVTGNAESGISYETAKLYQFDSATFTENVVDASMMTTEQGEYRFSGVIPSNYVLRFTYGNNSVIVDPSGNDVKNVSANDYKSTIYRGGNKEAADAMTDYWYGGETSKIEGVQRLSDAKDNDEFVQKRISEDEITYGTVTQNGTLSEISADTRMFDIKLEYDVENDNMTTYSDDVNNRLQAVFDNIDFGIIERPIQSLEVGKQVANIQIMLANGNDLINGDPRTQNLPGVRVLDDDVYIEIDNEIIQGATLRITYEISVDNSNCEIDYNNEDYYIYGTVPDGHAGWKTATVVDMYDYLPEDLVLQAGEDGNWQKVDLQGQASEIKGIILADKIYEEVKGLQNVVHLANPIFENIEPGQKAVDTSLVVSKVLSTSTDDLTYENDIEIVKLKGRSAHDSIPGNYNPTTNESYDPSTDTYRGDELDDDEVEVTITPPTGESRAYWIYVIIGVSILMIVGAGVVIIKKKVLRK